jgi:Icc-related predicted phosphoesterase
VALLCGDLTHYGEPSETMILLECLQTLQCPVIGVLGNHDFEGRKADTVTQLLQEAGVTILDGHTHTLRGIDFIGIKGFAGGFGKYALQAWGEPPLKDFVKETKNEAEKLDAALQQGKNPHRVVLLHYSPIRQTVEGEAEEIIPFLGSSAFEDVLMRHHVDVVFHGHAHHGQLQGKTRNNIPVFNVAMPLLQKIHSIHTPFFMHKIPVSTHHRP